MDRYLYLIVFILSACGDSTTDCNGTIFVNLSTTESVEVKATNPGSETELNFDTFTLAAEGKKKVCGDNSKSIQATYTWPNGDTTNLGNTSSTGDICIFLSDDHVAVSGSAGTCSV